MHLSSGFAWTIPVTLQIPELIADNYQLDSEIALVHPNGEIVAVMFITSKFKPNQDFEAEKIYLTTEVAHPGIKALRTEGEVYLGDSIQLINSIPHKEFLEYRLTPKASRYQFQKYK